MKKQTLKLVAGLLALTFGIIIIWVGGFFFVKSNFSENKPSEILFNFNGFKMNKDWVAEFEIVNDTAQPIYYDVCSVEFKSGERRVRAGNYFCTEHGNQLISLEAGERTTVSFEKQSVKDALYAEEFKPKVSAQIGIEVLTGAEKQRRRIWSVQKLTFPEELEFPENE